MDLESSVTTWIEHVKQADPSAAEQIWQRYRLSLLALASRKLAGAPRRSTDEEDVVQQAFAAFFQAAQTGRLNRLQGRDDLWALLVKITENKAIDARRRSHSLRRGGGRVRGDSALRERIDQSRPAGFAAIGEPSPGPELVVAAIDEYRRLLSLLQEEQLQEIVRLRLEGYTQDEIAGRIGCVRQTVIRKLKLIQTIWDQELPS